MTNPQSMGVKKKHFSFIPPPRVSPPSQCSQKDLMGIQIIKKGYWSGIITKHKQQQKNLISITDGCDMHRTVI